MGTAVLILIALGVAWALIDDLRHKPVPAFDMYGGAQSRAQIPSAREQFGVVAGTLIDARVPRLADPGDGASAPR